jgi:hypothetical protein
MLTDRPGAVTVRNRDSSADGVTGCVTVHSDSNADGGTVTLVLTVWHRNSSADGVSP